MMATPKRTPQEHVAGVRGQLEAVIVAMNEALADGVRIEFHIGTETATGKQVLGAFKAWSEIKTSN